MLDKVLEQDKASVKESVQMERRKHVQGGKDNPYKDPGIEDAKDVA